MVNKVHPDPTPVIESNVEEHSPINMDENIVEKKMDEGLDPPTADQGSNEQSHNPSIQPMRRRVGLDKLQEVESVKLWQTNRHMEDFANVQNIYDVEKSVNKDSGTKLYFGMESTPPDVRAKVKSSTNSSQPFAIKLVDRDNGSELLEIERHGLDRVPTSVYLVPAQAWEAKQLVGTIILQYGWLQKTPTFNIFDKEGCPILHLMVGSGSSSTRKETTFTVHKLTEDDGNGIQVASIVKDGGLWGRGGDSSAKEQIITTNYKDTGLDTLSRALILSTSFILDYTQFKPPNPLARCICCH